MDSKKIFLTTAILAAFALVGAGAAFGQTTPGTTVASVDLSVTADLETTASSVEAAAATDYEALMLKLSADFGVEISTLNGLISEGYKPGQIWLALEISKNSTSTTGAALTLEQALALTNGTEGHGWGVLAAKLGIDPGSKEFLALKERVEAHTRTMLSGVAEEHGNRTSATVRSEAGAAYGSSSSGGSGAPGPSHGGLGDGSHAGSGSGGKR